MGTGPDSAAMGNALKTRWKSERAFGSNTWQTVSTRTQNWALVLENHLIALVHQLRHRQNGFVNPTHLERTLDELPILNLEVQVGFSVLFKAVLSGEDGTEFRQLLSTRFRSVR